MVIKIFLDVLDFLHLIFFRFRYLDKLLFEFLVVVSFFILKVEKILQFLPYGIFIGELFH